MKLPEIGIKENHYWSIVLYDESLIESEHYHYDTKEEAEKTMEQMVQKNLVTRRIIGLGD